MARVARYARAPRLGRGRELMTVATTVALTAASTAACTPQPEAAGRPLPQFVSAVQADFMAGKSAQFIIRAVGYRGKIFEHGILPPGLALTDNHAGTAVITGDPVRGGRYIVNLATARSADQVAGQTLAIVVDQAPQLIADATSQWSLASRHLTFTMHATGYPLPTITIAGKLPPALRLRTHPGLATISGHLKVSWLKGVLALVLGGISAVLGLLTDGVSLVVELGVGATVSGARSWAERLLYTSRTITAIASNGIGRPSTLTLTLHVFGPN